MSGLSLGGPALQWSHPSPVYKDGGYTTGGMVWLGSQACTVRDQQDWVDFLNSDHGGNLTIDDIKWDYDSFVGTHHRDWTSNHYTHATGKAWNKPGGWGSKIYMMQQVGMDDLQFAEYDIETGEQKEIWHYPKDGYYGVDPKDRVMVKAVPGDAGEYHSVDVGGGYVDYVEGPEPGTPAADYLGDSHYYIDFENGWFEVVGKEEVEVTPPLGSGPNYCSNCGEPNPGPRYCPNCGTPQG